MGPLLFISDYDGDMSPGMSTVFEMQIENQGSRSMVDYSLDLLPHGNQVTVQSSSIMIEELLSGENISLDDFELTFSENIINGTVLPLELLITSPDGFTRTHFLNVLV